MKELLKPGKFHCVIVVLEGKFPSYFKTICTLILASMPESMFFESPGGQEA